MAKQTDNRTERVAIRLDAAERKMADAVARHAGLNVSDWFRLTVRQAYAELRPVRKPPAP